MMFERFCFLLNTQTEYISVNLPLSTLTSSSDISKQTLTQLNAPSTGKGGGTSFGNRCRRGLTNNGLVF